MSNELVLNPEVTEQGRTHALIARCMPLIGLLLPGAGVLGVAAVYMVASEPFAKAHARSELFNQFLFLIVMFLAGLFTMFTFGFGAVIVVPMLLLMGLCELPFWVFSLMAASRGEAYEYPWLRPFAFAFDR